MHVEAETGVNMEGEMDVYVERQEVCRQGFVCVLHVARSVYVLRVQTMM